MTYEEAAAEARTQSWSVVEIQVSDDATPTWTVHAVSDDGSSFISGPWPKRALGRREFIAFWQEQSS